MEAFLDFDINEPAEMWRLLEHTIPIVSSDLNNKGWADYRWYDFENNPVHVERKTWYEVFDIDRVEDQLARHLGHQPHARLIFLLEGVPMGSVSGTALYRPTSGAHKMFVPNREDSRPTQMVYSWLYQVEKYCEVYCTSCLAESSRALVSFFRADQTGDHTTFKRHIKKIAFAANPQVSMLMSVADGIGEVKAKEMIAHYGTLLNVLNAPIEDMVALPGIGKVLATKLLRRVGRSDV